jgi:hypothetical protein
MLMTVAVPNKQVHFETGGVFNDSGLDGDEAWNKLVPGESLAKGLYPSELMWL